MNSNIVEFLRGNIISKHMILTGEELEVSNRRKDKFMSYGPSAPIC